MLLDFNTNGVDMRSLGMLHSKYVACKNLVSKGVKLAVSTHLMCSSRKESQLRLSIYILTGGYSILL